MNLSAISAAIAPELAPTTLRGRPRTAPFQDVEKATSSQVRAAVLS